MKSKFIFSGKKFAIMKLSRNDTDPIFAIFDLKVLADPAQRMQRARYTWSVRLVYAMPL